MTARRTALRALGASALVAGASSLGAQQPAKVPRVGVLSFGSPDMALIRSGSARFRQRLAEHGYVEGKSIVLEMRYAENDPQRLSRLARELVASGVDVIVTPTVATTVAARQATGTIPIVMLHAGNPVGAWLIASLARPGGNVTGTSNLFLGGKQVQLLREVVPRLARLAVLANPTNAGAAPALAELSHAARSFGITLTVVEVARAENVANALTAVRDSRPEGLLVLIDPVITVQRKQVIEFATSQRLPLVTDGGDIARDGGLMSYGPDFLDHYTVGADYVDKILKGAKPADLPVQLSRKFDFVINLRTAKALGLTIPPALLVGADEVIE